MGATAAGAPAETARAASSRSKWAMLCCAAVVCVALFCMTLVYLFERFESTFGLSGDVCKANLEKGRKAYNLADQDENFYLSYAEVVRWGEIMYGDDWGGVRREQCFKAFDDRGLGMPHKWLENFQSCCDAEGK